MSAARQILLTPLEAAEHKMSKAVDKGQGCVSLTRAEWSALWMKENSRPTDAPLSCCCAQRPYPHDLSAHRKLFEAPGSYDAFDERIRFAPEGMRWPWSLRFAQETEAR